MGTATAVKLTLREVVLAAIEDDYRTAQVEECLACDRQPAGICGDHQADNDAAWFYDDARRQIEQSPGSAEVLAVLGAEEWS